MDAGALGLAFCAILGIVVIEVTALRRGQNGKRLGSCLAILGGVVGLCFGLGL